MKLTKTTSFVVSGITTAFVNIAVIANTYQSPAQAIVPPVSGDIVFNGGFELDPLVNPMNPNQANPYITGWNKYTDGEAFNTNLIQIDNFGNMGGYGLYIAPLERTYLSQTLSTMPTQEYNLTFYLASTDETPNVNNYFQVYVGGNLIADLQNVDFQGYTKYSYTFTAPLGLATELKFATKTTYNFLFLDDVSVAPVDAVPEPLTIGGVALAGVMGTWMKRKQAQKDNNNRQ